MGEVAEIVMPRLSDSMEEGTVLSWLKAVGEEVAVGEELVEIETDKANMVYESDVAGTVLDILIENGATATIGTVIAMVGDPAAYRPGERRADGAAPETAAANGSGGAGPGAGAQDDPAPAAAAGSEPATKRAKASPLARRLARAEGIALDELSGSGPGGRITKSDVERALAERAGEAPGGPATGAAPAAPGGPPAPAAPAAPAGDASGGPKGEADLVQLSRLQRTVARRMSESKAVVPHFYLETEVDMTAAVRARAELLAGQGADEVRFSYNDMVVRACAIALREYPRANGAYRDGSIELFSRVNVGVAVAADDALVVPTINDADRKGLREIAAEARALAQRVREGTITPPELSGGTFTVSNLGMYGVTSFNAIVNVPQAAILAVGAIREVPVARDGAIVVAPVMPITISCDHRILYGAEAAQFLARVRALLEQPLGLAL